MDAFFSLLLCVNTVVLLRQSGSGLQFGFIIYCLNQFFQYSLLYYSKGYCKGDWHAPH